MISPGGEHTDKTYTHEAILDVKHIKYPVHLTWVFATLKIALI